MNAAIVHPVLLARSIVPFLHSPICYGGLTGGVLRFCSSANVEKKDEIIEGKPRSVTVHAAHQLLQAGHFYLDVRTWDEFRAGHPAGAINIPYMIASEAGRVKNDKFLEEVSSRFKKQHNMIIGCQSGKRSLMAAADLQSAGFTKVTDVAGGYLAWKENGLPTSE